MRIRAILGGLIPAPMRIRATMAGRRRLWKPDSRTVVDPAGCPDAANPGYASLPAREDLPRLRTVTGRTPDEGSAAQFGMAPPLPRRVRLCITAHRPRTPGAGGRRPGGSRSRGE